MGGTSNTQRVNTPCCQGAVRLSRSCQEAVKSCSQKKTQKKTSKASCKTHLKKVDKKIHKKTTSLISVELSGAVKELSACCRRAVGPALRGNPSSTEVKSCQSAPQGVSTDPCQADTKKFRPALLAVQGVFTLCHESR